MKDLKRDIKKLDRKTGRKTTIGIGIPHPRDGQDGDITLRKTPEGKELFAKIDDMWYGTRLFQVPGTIRNTIHSKVIRAVPPKTKPPKKDDPFSIGKGGTIGNDPSQRSSTSNNRSNKTLISQLSNNVVLKDRTTGDVVLKNSKTATASPNIKLFNDTVGGTGASYIPTLQFIKSPASGLTAMADGDSLGLIVFLGDDDDSTDGSVGYGTIRCIATDVTHATKNSKLEFSTLHDGTTLQTMTLDGRDLTISGDLNVNGNNINFDADSHSTIAVGASSGTNTAGYRLSLDGGQSTGNNSGGSAYLRTCPLGSSGSSANSLVTILGVNGTTAEGNVGIKAGCQLFFDGAAGGLDTYIEESSGDILDIYVGGDKALSLNENTSYIDVDSNWTFRAGALEVGSATNKWGDGYHGNSTKIALLPNDFFLSNASGSRVDSVGLYSDDDGGSGKIKDASKNVYAMKIIPKGFTATHVRVSCSSVIASAVTPHDGNIANDTINSHTAGATNGDVAFSGTDPVGDGDTYVVVEFNPGSTGDQIYGGTITIARTT